MRDLDTANAALKSTKHVFTISLIIPFFMGFGAWALAEGAAPALRLQDNYLEMFALGLMALAILLLPIPHIFKWNWETKYFGAGILSFGSGSIIGVYPVLCIIKYSSLPIALPIAFAAFEGALVIWWCRRFVTAYKYIFNDKRMFSYIYREEIDEVYYLQQADKKMIEKIIKIDQLPGTKLTILPMTFALALTPFASSISHYIGTPFIHIFLAISMTPVNLMFLGLSTRAWLVFYHYPNKIKKATNKRVYIDKSSSVPNYAHVESLRKQR